MIKKASIMGMPITIDIRDAKSVNSDFDEVFKFLDRVDKKYSPFKDMSEVSKFNRGEKVSREMKNILLLCDKLKRETRGYFDPKRPDGKTDPSGLVKGWAIKKAADILRNKGFKKFFVDAGGDAEIVGKNWKWGVRNPFNVKQIVKVLRLTNCGIATSGTYERGQHIYNPITKQNKITDIVSLTVIGKDVYEADKFSTPAFAMGRSGIEFIETVPGLEGYMIDNNGVATMTSGFSKYEIYR